MAGFSFQGVCTMVWDDMAQALLLAALNKALIDFLAEPVTRKFPGVDLWWLNYVALVTGVVVAWFAGVDFLTGVYVKAPLAGRILTCLTVGAGTTLINKVFVGSSSNGQVTARGFDSAMADVPGPKYRGW